MINTPASIKDGNEGSNNIKEELKDLSGGQDRMFLRTQAQDDEFLAECLRRRDAACTEWKIVSSLSMPTAMHAHSAITIPLLPSSGSS